MSAPGYDANRFEDGKNRDPSRSGDALKAAIGHTRPASSLRIA
jgi:hypothetical protein